MRTYCRRDWVIALALAIVMTILFSMHLTLGCTSWGDDWAAYITEGIAISQNTFDEQIIKNHYLHPTPLPLEANDGKLVYVWGYPLILSIVHRLVGFNSENYSSIIFYKIPSIIALSLTISILFLFYRRSFSLRISLFLVLMFAVSGELIHSAETMTSDVMFLFFSLLSIWLAECFLDTLLNTSKFIVHVLLSILLAVVLWFCYETRLSGQSVVIMVAAFNVIELLRNKEKCSAVRYSINSLTYFLFFLLTAISEAILAPATPNLSDIGSTSIVGILENILYYGALTCEYLGRSDSMIGYLLGFILAVIFLLGFLLDGFKVKNIHFSVFLVGTYVVLILLPYHQGIRYIYNILPIIIMYVTYGAQRIYAKILEAITREEFKTAARRAPSVLAIFIIIFIYSGVLADGLKNIENDRLGNEKDVYSIESMDVYHYIQSNIHTDSSIVFFKPRVLYLNTGRLSFAPYSNEHTIGDADYFLFYKHDTNSLQDRVLSDNEVSLSPQYENDSFTLYRIVN